MQLLVKVEKIIILDFSWIIIIIGDHVLIGLKTILFIEYAVPIFYIQWVSILRNLIVHTNESSKCIFGSKRDDNQS